MSIAVGKSVERVESTVSDAPTAVSPYIFQSFKMFVAQHIYLTMLLGN